MLRFVLSAGLLLLATPALADSIDGDWCDGEAAQIQITGPQITTPSGQTLQGQYRRHEFAYQSPAGEADAGKLIYMQLRDEDNMTSYIIENDKPTLPRNWTRCALKPKTS